MSFRVLLLICFVVPVSLRSRGMDMFLEARHYEHVYTLPSNDALVALSLGFREALADLIWLRALVYVGDDLANRAGLEYVFHYGEAMIHLDPDFRRAYSWTSTIGLYRPSATLDDGLRSVGYLERAVDRFPSDGELVWQLATAYSYELPSLTRDPAARRRYREIGSEHMVTAARLGAGVRWLALTNATNLEALGRIDQAIAHLEEMYVIVRDDATREEIAVRLESLRAEARATVLRAAEADLRERAQESFPWVPVDFTAVLGPRRVPSTR